MPPEIKFTDDVHVYKTILEIDNYRMLEQIVAAISPEITIEYIKDSRITSKNIEKMLSIHADHRRRFKTNFGMKLYLLLNATESIDRCKEYVQYVLNTLGNELNPVFEDEVMQQKIFDYLYTAIRAKCTTAENTYEMIADIYDSTGEYMNQKFFMYCYNEYLEDAMKIEKVFDQYLPENVAESTSAIPVVEVEVDVDVSATAMNEDEITDFM
jgi:hypothetical protein